MRLILDNLLPGEAAIVSGVSLDNQRNLRRAGYLPKVRGHARFSIVETARLLVFGLMSERGIGPKLTSVFADTAARGIFQKLIWISTIYSNEIGPPALEATQADLERAKANSNSEAESDFSDDDYRSLHGSLAKQYIVEAAQDATGTRGEIAPSFFFLWANDHPEFFYDDAHPFGDYDFDIPAWQGPAIMLPIGGVADLMARRLPRSVIHLAREGND